MIGAVVNNSFVKLWLASLLPDQKLTLLCCVMETSLVFELSPVWVLLMYERIQCCYVTKMVLAECFLFMHMEANNPPTL